jgi:CBS domain-containing protein
VALPLKKQVAKDLDLMSSPALVIKPETTVQEISELFGHWKVNRVPVVNEAGRLGVLSLGVI